MANTEHTIKLVCNQIKHKDIQGRRIKGYSVRFVDVESDTFVNAGTADIDVKRKIEQACSTHHPYHSGFEFNDVHYIVFVSWNTLSGWEYRYTIIDLRAGAVQPAVHHNGQVSVGFEKSRNRAIAECFSHMAQWLYGTTANKTYARSYVFDSICLQSYDMQAYRDFVRWANWQDRYQVIAAKGYSSNECHRLAGQTETIEQAQAVPEFQLTAESEVTQ